MATLEEVLALESSNDYIHDNIQFIIDEDMRTIAIPPKGVVAGVTGDKNVNYINFKMNRFYNGIDLSDFNIRINYVNANGEVNYYTVTDMIVEDDDMLFTWLIGSDAVKYVGKVLFGVKLYTLDGIYIKESLNTSKASLNVLEGLDVDEYVTPEEQEELINHIKDEVIDSLSGQYLSSSDVIQTVLNEEGELDPTDEDMFKPISLQGSIELVELGIQHVDEAFSEAMEDAIDNLEADIDIVDKKIDSYHNTKTLINQTLSSAVDSIEIDKILTENKRFYAKRFSLIMDIPTLPTSSKYPDVYIRGNSSSYNLFTKKHVACYGSTTGTNHTMVYVNGSASYDLTTGDQAVCSVASTTTLGNGAVIAATGGYRPAITTINAPNFDYGISGIRVQLGTSAYASSNIAAQLPAGTKIIVVGYEVKVMES